MLFERLTEQQGYGLLIEYYLPRDVFTMPLPNDADLAFITVNNMAQVETMRQFHLLYSDIPFVVVSDSKDYAVEGFRFSAKGYLTRPIEEDAVSAFLGMES